LPPIPPSIFEAALSRTLNIFTCSLTLFFCKFSVSQLRLFAAYPIGTRKPAQRFNLRSGFDTALSPLLTFLFHQALWLPFSLELATAERRLLFFFVCNCFHRAL
jgi:hypothetical protein